MVPKDNLIPMPQDMNPAHAALTEPAATAIHATRLAERALFGSIESTAVLVIGAGSIGLLSALALQAQGVEQITITEANAMRCASAARTGDWKIIDGAKTAPPPGAYDLIIDAVGSHTSRHIALSAVGAGGVVIHIGLADNDGAIDVHRMTRHEITLMGAYTYTAQDLEDALHQLHRGSLGDLSWIETRQLLDGPNAFRDLDAGRIAAGKIILIP
jgi:alcohol dehydrogenase